MPSNRTYIRMDNTKFIFRTNFSGNPDNDTYGSDARKGTIIIPSEELANSMLAEGLNVKTTKPREGYEDEYVPMYYISFKVNYNSNRQPAIYLVGTNGPMLLDANSVGTLDGMYVKNVNAIFNVYTNQRTGKKSLYVETMYVEQDVSADPYAAMYMNMGN